MSCPRSIVIPSVTPSISSWRISLQALGVLSFIAFQRFHFCTPGSQASLWRSEGTNQATFLLQQNNHQNDASDLSKCFVKVCEMQLVQTLSETMICQKEQENNESINICMETWFCLAKGWIQPLFLHFSLEKIWMHHSRSVPELLGAF